MLTLNEAVAIRTANDRIADLETRANHVIAGLQRQLANERAAKVSALTALQQSEIRVAELEDYVSDLEAIVADS